MALPEVAFCGAALPWTSRKCRRAPARACAQHEDVTDAVLHRALRARRVALHGPGAVAAEDVAAAARIATAAWAYRSQDELRRPELEGYRGVGHRDFTPDEGELVWERVAGDGNEDGERCSVEDRALVVNAVTVFTVCWLLGIAFALSI